MLVEQISSYKTLNEARISVDLPALPGGDVPMNPAYFQGLQAQTEAAGGEVGDEIESEGPPKGGGAEGPAEPKYSNNFGFDQKAEA